MRRRLLCTLACLPALAACSLPARMAGSRLQSEAAAQSLAGHHAQFRDGLLSPEARRARQQVGRPWVAGRARPLARELSLPPALRAHVATTLLFADGWLDLSAIALRITAATGIPVHVRPDALLPASAFMPLLAGPAADGAALSGTAERAPLAGEDEPLASILDRLCASLGVYWAYHQGRIEFYRTQTRVFDVRALTLEARAEAALGSGGDAPSETGFDARSRTTFSAGDQEDVFKVVRARLAPFLSRSGVLVAQAGASATIVVTDTPPVLENIARYLEQENRVLSRRVRLVFEELTLAAQDGDQLGLDWNLVFSSARVAALGSMAAAAPSADAAALSAGVVHGPFMGTDALLGALSQSARIVRRSSVPVLTLNRRPVTHAVRTTFSYIDKIDTTAGGERLGMALPSVSVSQKEETVGSVLTLVPDAQDDGRILLSIAYDNTVAQPLRSLRFGNQANPLQLQQLTVEGNGTVQQVLLQPGQPVLVSGFERRHTENESRRAGPGLPLLLGGSDRHAAEQLTTVLIVTAQVEDGV